MAPIRCLLAASLFASAAAFQAPAAKAAARNQVVMADKPNAGVVAGLAALTVAASSAGALTKEEVNSMSYDQIKGTGLANRCAQLPKDDTSGAIKLSSGKKYKLGDLCIEPKTFQVLEETTDKKGQTSSKYVDTKLMTRETYSLYGVEGPLTSDGSSYTFKEKDGIDYAATTVQLPGGERVPFLFTVKELVATGKGDTIKSGSTFGGKFSVPSYRSGAFLDPKGRGMYTGYDMAQALAALTMSDDMLLFAENNKKFDTLAGQIEFKVTGASADGDFEGVFVSQQPSDTDMGGKAPTDLLIKGIFYGTVTE